MKCIGRPIVYVNLTYAKTSTAMIIFSLNGLAWRR